MSLLPPPPGGGSGNGNGNGQPNVPAVPSPSPGKLYDPQGKDISQGQPPPDPNKQVQDLKPQVAPAAFASGFDVNPLHVWYTSYLIRNHQSAFDKAPRRLMDTLRGHQHVCGVGSGPEAFERAYEEVSGEYLEVWAASVVAIGGVSTGLTLTANNYIQAHYASNPSLGTPTSLKPLPDVIRIPPYYGLVPYLGWRTGGGDNFAEQLVNDILGVLGTAVQWLIRQVMDKALNHGRVGQITPGGDDLAIPKVAAAWKQIAIDAKSSGDDLDAAVNYLKNPDSAATEWQDAMGQVTSDLWGTATWGKGSGAAVAQGYNWKRSMNDQPVLRVLIDTANKIADALDAFAKEVHDVRKVIENEYVRAAKDLLETDSVKNFLEDLAAAVFGGPPAVAKQFLDNLNEGVLNAGVDRYNANTHQLAQNLKNLLPALREARRSVPSFQAEEARAQSVGARAIEGYGTGHKWTVPGDQATNHTYPIDLANQEDMTVGNQAAHVIDRHVGLTPEELQRRMRDDSNAPRASAFPDLATAQRLVQEAIDKRSADISQEIQTNPNNPNTITYLVPFGSDVTGVSVDTSNGVPTPVHNVLIRIQLVNDGRQPPFIVVTAFPERP
ncbi:RNase A-like domain-containing protein [Streptomyces venezuelae]|uniref:RNase A-like domain-containing protein n=1 Tax=Streptomyces venezuelae TaxID=54571 RepID=UPI0037CD31D9